MKRQAEYHFARDDEYDYLDNSFHMTTVTSTGVKAITGFAQYSLLCLRLLIDNLYLEK